MTKEEFSKLKAMLASTNVDDMNLAGLILTSKLGLTEKATKDNISLKQFCDLLQVFYDNLHVGFHPDDGKCDYTALFKGILKQTRGK